MNEIQVGKMETMKNVLSRQTAMENGRVEDFNSWNVKNYAKKIYLKAPQLEFKLNFNYRYFTNEKKFYAGLDDLFQSLAVRSDGNPNRNKEMMNEACESSSLQSQYICFHKDLVEKLVKILENLLELEDELSNLGVSIKNSIDYLKKALVLTNKDYLVIDGNTYWINVEICYELLKNKNKKNFNVKTDYEEIKHWAKRCKQIKSLGVCYYADCLSENEYQRELQCFQFIAMILEKNVHTWESKNVDAFCKSLLKILFAIVYKEHKRKNFPSVKDFFLAHQALSYLIVPQYKNGTRINFSNYQPVNYISFIALFGHENEKPVELTTFNNIDIFKKIIKGIYNVKVQSDMIDYCMKRMPLIYNAMLRYEQETLKLYAHSKQEMVRNRLTQISNLEYSEEFIIKCNNLATKFYEETEFNNILNEIVDIMYDKWDEKLSNDIHEYYQKLSLSKNINLNSDKYSIDDIFELRNQLSLEQFKNLINNIYNDNSKEGIVNEND